MTQKDVATYYSNLSRGDKGRFIAFVSLHFGGTDCFVLHKTKLYVLYHLSS